MQLNGDTFDTTHFYKIIAAEQKGHFIGPNGSISKRCNKSVDNAFDKLSEAQQTKLESIGGN